MSREGEGGALPHLVIGGVMPCHAFTDKTLLLAQGERIGSALQLERLLRADVIFAQEPPPHLAGAVAERQRALGIAPSATSAPPPRARPLSPPRQDGPADSELAAWMPPGWPVPAPRNRTRVPFHVEIAEAQNIHREALRQVRELTEQARNRRSLNLEPVYDTVGQVVTSLERNEQAFASLLWVKSRDDALHKHMINTCVLAAMLAEPAGLREHAQALALGALMHDIGKVCLPTEDLRGHDGLSAAQGEFQEHPAIGAALAARCGLPAVVMEAISQHHERFDGCGYPLGLRGAAISPAGRVVAVANAYDALTAESPTHTRMLASEAMRAIAAQAGKAFDPQAVGSLVQAVGLFPVGSVVALSTGERAIVAALNASAIARPTVLVIANSPGDTNTKPYLLDLSQRSHLFSGREIVDMENPYCSDVDVVGCLAMVPELAAQAQPSLSSLA